LREETNEENRKLLQQNYFGIGRKSEETITLLISRKIKMKKKLAWREIIRNRERNVKKKDGDRSKH